MKIHLQQLAQMAGLKLNTVYWYARKGYLPQSWVGKGTDLRSNHLVGLKVMWYLAKMGIRGDVTQGVVRHVAGIPSTLDYKAPTEWRGVSIDLDLDAIYRDAVHQWDAWHEASEANQPNQDEEKSV